jgi:beta-lactamase regulating signal transducer with metallopeptidase domain/archaellum component FlaC
MDLSILVLGSTKALLLLAMAASAALALHGRPARLRAVVLGTALAGSLVIPAVSPLVPTLAVPVSIPSLETFENREPELAVLVPAVADPAIQRAHEAHAALQIESSAPRFRLDWQTTLVAVWALGALVMLARLGVGLWRMARAVSSAQVIDDPTWLALLDQARARVGCDRRVRLVVSSELEIPATFGILRPVIAVPQHSATWLRDRREAVLLHELMHICRLDWPVRIIARVARAVYWFNPLAWWALRRLDLEQELACDEEVLACGTRASNYACHLLGIASAAMRSPLPAVSGLEMARKSQLEERIMTILKRTTHRRLSLAVLAPSVIIIAALVPALAAVHPGDPAARPASPELKQILSEMEATEAELEPHLERIQELEIELQPKIEVLEEIEVEIDHDAIAEIEERMRPYLEGLEDIEIEMQPHFDRIAELEEQLQSVTIHVDDGTLEEVQRQIHEQVEAHMEGVRDIHVDLEVFHERMEEIHEQLEPLHQELAEIHIQMEPVHLHMEKIHESMEPFHEKMEEIHREMEPIHERMELLGERLEEALRRDVAALLRDHLGSVTTFNAPIDEAAARIVEDAHVHVHDEVVELDVSRREVREILSDLLSSHRVGTQDAFDEAVKAAADALSPMTISVE